MFLAKTVETGDKNRSVTKAMYRIESCQRCRASSEWVTGSVHEFYRLQALITLQQVINSVVNKMNNLNEQNFDGETNWSGAVNFHCRQMSLVTSMPFIFGDN